jgi:hypothetical protein
MLNADRNYLAAKSIPLAKFHIPETGNGAELNVEIVGQG